MLRAQERRGWYLVEQVPSKVAAKVLLLPGLFCTDRVYENMLRDPALETVGLHMTAANPPGFKGVAAPPGFDFKVASYAPLVESFARSEGVNLIVGHGFFANALIEVALRGRFEGRLMLLSPWLDRGAAPEYLSVLESIRKDTALTWLNWLFAYRKLDTLFRPYFELASPEVVDAFVAEAKKTPRAVARQLTYGLFDYLDAHGSLVERLAKSSANVLIVRGSNEKVPLSSTARGVIAKAPSLRLHEIQGSRDFPMFDRPSEVNALILKSLRA